MAYAGLLDGGLRVYAGCASDWTGGVDYTSQAHGLEFESTANGIGGGSFWFEVADAFDLSARPEIMHGSRVNIYHTYDATTTYLYKGFIINDPRRGAVGETTPRVTVELGGPAEVARWRTDCAFSFTDADTSEWWFENKRNNKVFNCQTRDSIEISVDKGEKVPDNKRGGLISYIPYLGAQYMIGTNAQNRWNGVKRIDGYIHCVLGDGMEARILVPHNRDAEYNDERYVDAAYWDTVKTWTSSIPGGRYFDSNDWGHVWGTDGVKHFALALYSTNVAGTTNVMSADRYVRLDPIRCITGTIAKRPDEAMLDIATWVGLHNTSATSNLFSVVQTLVARPYTDPVTAIGDLALNADCIVEWGWFTNRSTNGIQFRARPLATGEQAIKDSTTCYTIDPLQSGTTWDVRTHPEDGQGDVRAVRLLYGRLGKKSNWPPGVPNGVIGKGDGLTDPGFRNTGGPFQGATANVVTVDFSQKKFTDEHAKRMAKNLGRLLKKSQAISGEASSRALTVTRTSGGAAFPWAYIQGGDFVVCSRDTAIKPLLVTSCHVDVDSQTVSLELGLPADTLLRQLEAAGSIKKVRLRRK